MGNRLQKQDSVSGTTNSLFDAANRLTSTTGTEASTYSNDLDGNTLTGGGRTSTWDSQNRMKSCTTSGSVSDYTYGADGLRRTSIVTPTGGSAVTTNNVYDGTMLVQEQRGSGAFATYLNGARGPECRVDETQPSAETGYRSSGSSPATFQRGPAKWYVHDGLGSVVGEVDPSGNLTSSPKYDVYGAMRGNAGTASSRQGFVGGLGHVSDRETGLIYMRARYYDPSNGRFVSQDPSKNGINWFAYCDNNPINEVDQTGKAGGPVIAVPPALGWFALIWVLTQALAQTGALGNPWSRLLQDADWVGIGGSVFVGSVGLALVTYFILDMCCGSDSPDASGSSASEIDNHWC